MESKEALNRIKTNIIITDENEDYIVNQLDEDFETISNELNQKQKQDELLEILKPLVLAQKTLIKNKVICNKDFEKILETKIIKEWLENE